FHRAEGDWEIHLRGLPGLSRAQRVRVEVRDDRIVRVTRDGSDIGAAALEPEVLASAGDRPGEDHRPVRLRDVPFSLLQAVLAAEDHRFFDHPGVDLRGLVRAAWVNFRAGRVTQGGGMIRAPNTYSPTANPARARERRDVVLARMRELGRLSDADYEAARREPVRARVVVAASQTAPYFADHVRQEMEVRFGNGALDARHVRVFTTLDLTLQRLAENAVERGLVRLEVRRPQLRGADDGHRLQAV